MIMDQAETNLNSDINPKSSGWDLVGAKFWRLGRVSARPSKSEINMFLSDIPPGSNCIIIGASTKDLVIFGLKSKLKIIVLDFSTVMCSDLKYEINSSGFDCEIICHDILKPPPAYLQKIQCYVLADRLINRFTRSETLIFMKNIFNIVKEGGELRMSVKLGLYDMDKALIEEGQKRGTLSKFFDSTSKTINFATASEELKSRLLPHGHIPRHILLEWYHARGMESRFNDEDVKALFMQASIDNPRYCLIETSPFPDSPETVMYRARITKRSDKA